MSIDTDSTAFPSSHSPDTFDSDDLHFRTTTSLLHLLGKRDKDRPRHDMSPSMKRLATVSFILARSGEVVACMPKRTNTAMTILLATPESFGGSEEAASPDLLITRNPREVKPGKVESGEVRAGDVVYNDRVELRPAEGSPVIDPHRISAYLVDHR
jgi:hypothetical protein